MKLFWEHGYDGVSMSDVTAATGVNRRGIYAEFGSKEHLFERAKPRTSRVRAAIWRGTGQPDGSRCRRGDGSRCGRHGQR